ncbi:AAA family ATPase [Noviherbaspirillum soli]|uniref:AAA family ATPase n=1 Tax=Noviherbaspirillum soli TaxID=1064518 RepID=UPI00188D9F6C|nr:AAA family ATPase [Noviherbaspirillum soli]
MLTTLAIANYRSIRHLVIPLNRLNIVTGANGSGKSSLYHALRLLAFTAQGRLIAALADEGGLQSTLWAGPETISAAVRQGEHSPQGTRRKEPVNLKLGFGTGQLGYAIDLGLPLPSSSMFGSDPEIKRECIWSGAVLRPAALLVDRKNWTVHTRASDGAWRQMTETLSPFDSMLAELADPNAAPEMLMLREQIRSWRFYDQLRTDIDAPARRAQIATHTAVLTADGASLAATWQTIREIGDAAALNDAVSDAFPGARVGVRQVGNGLQIEMWQHGLLRALSAAELSEGTLRYLLCIAALLSPRPPALMVLNEPETSLHPDLLPALARLIVKASGESQIVVVSHSTRLAAALEREGDAATMTLEKDYGETVIQGVHALERPAWHWPKR